MLAAALVAAGAAYFLGGSKDGSGVGPEPEAPPAEANAPRGPGLAAADPRPVMEPAPAPAKPQKIRIRGTLTRKEGEGPPQRFTVALDNIHGERGSARRFDGSDGRFEIESPYAGRQSLRIVSLDGRDVDIPLPAIEADADATREFEVPRSFPFALIVVDAETQKPIGGAEACRIPPEDAPRVRRLVNAPPVDRRVFTGRNGRRADAAGRIDLPSSTESSLWVVVEDGHAWAQVEARFGAEKSATVELRKGGRGTVRVIGWKEVEDGTLELHAAEGARSEPLPGPDPTGALYLAGVPTGTYTVALRRGAAENAGPVVATAEIRASPFPAFLANLDARGGGAPSAGRVIVTFEYPAEWLTPAERGRPVHAMVEFEGDDPATRGIDDPHGPVTMEPGRPVTIESIPLPRGTYRVEISPFGWRGSATISDGDVRMHVVIERPAYVVCHVRDAKTGQDVERSYVRWWLEAKSGSADQHGGGEERPGLVRLKVVPGRLRLKASGNGHRESEERTLDVAAGQTAEMTFDLGGRAPLKVTVREDGKPLAAPVATVLVEKNAASIHVVERHVAQNGVADWYDLSAGTYSVTLAPIEGYEAPEAKTAEMRDGETTTVVFDVVRKK